jgi:hypothetical protein
MQYLMMFLITRFSSTKLLLKLGPSKTCCKSKRQLVHKLCNQDSKFSCISDILKALKPQMMERNVWKSRNLLLCRQYGLGGIQVLRHHVFGFIRPTHPHL